MPTVPDEATDTGPPKSSPRARHRRRWSVILALVVCVTAAYAITVIVLYVVSAPERAAIASDRARIAELSRWSGYPILACDESGQPRCRPLSAIEPPGLTPHASADGGTWYPTLPGAPATFAPRTIIRSPAHPSGHRLLGLHELDGQAVYGWSAGGYDYAAYSALDGPVDYARANLRSDVNSLPLLVRAWT